MSISDDWIDAAASKYGTTIVVITGVDWDNDLTPWKAPGEPKGSPDFKGFADDFFNTLTKTVVPFVENRIGCSQSPERTLVGVSLSGLFSLWQWARSDFFHNIASLSGSFWYKGFVEWVRAQSFSGKTGKCFMLLGDAEPHSRNKTFATVGKCTEEIASYLRRQGVDITYRTVRGNHYQYPMERLEMAMSNVYMRE
ncbi:MAG: alpha/beta hydrolase-fold protein [Bacteroides sp.]|nr:alpha/beta hydrolase-fold protein [Bacteroides sp.]